MCGSPVVYIFGYVTRLTGVTLVKIIIDPIIMTCGLNHCFYEGDWLPQIDEISPEW